VKVEGICYTEINTKLKYNEIFYTSHWNWFIFHERKLREGTWLSDRYQFLSCCCIACALLCHVHFVGSKLPKDDGEFYQFCYVAASGQVRGASPPFQFKHPMTDDLIEVEDENGELLVIRTKTAVLEDQLKKANETRAELKQVTLFPLPHILCINGCTKIVVLC